MRCQNGGEAMREEIDLLKISGYSEKAIDYVVKKLNVGHVESPDVSLAYAGPCGDSMEISLKIESNVIKEAKFRAVGCAGAFASGSALTEMIKEKTLDQAKEIDEEDILNHLEGIPAPKIHCACLAKETLKRTINKYKEMSKR